MSLITEVITGVKAVVNNFSTFGSLRLRHEVRANPFFHSAGDGGADRVEGNIDFTGLIRAYGYQPTVFPGETFDLSFTVSGSDQVKSNTGQTAATTCRCMGLDIVIEVNDQRRQNAVYYDIMFGAAGYDLSYAGESPPTDEATPAVYAVHGLTCLLDAAEEDNVTSMRLSIRNLAEGQPNSATNGVFYRPLGNIDWQFVYRRDYNAHSVLPTKNAIHGVTMQVAAAKTWIARYGRVLNINTDIIRGSRKALEAEITIAKCNNGTISGAIIDPASVTQWP